MYRVMVFSFIGDKGRILHAHFDGSNPFIQKSPIIDCSSVGDFERDFQLFLRYVGITPIRDTALRVKISASARKH